CYVFGTGTKVTVL
nr:unnamed protein product [Homo sapiens]